jgi:hypothetical protein
MNFKSLFAARLAVPITSPSAYPTAASLCLLLSLSALCAHAQVPAPSVAPMGKATELSPYSVVERGPHHRVWQRVTAQTNHLGRVLYHTNAYTELATGMHYQKDGQWVEASEEIKITATGAEAEEGQATVVFSGELNTPGPSTSPLLRANIFAATSWV